MVGAPRGLKPPTIDLVQGSFKISSGGLISELIPTR
jgi:hypothetical protein